MTIAWPSTDQALMLWALLLLAWVVAVHYVGRTTSIWGRTKHEAASNWLRASAPRLVMIAVAPFVLYGTRIALSTILALVGVTLAVGLTAARERGKESWRSRGAEFELGATGAYIILSALAVGDANVTPPWSLIVVSLPDARVAALTFTVAITLFLINGGTQIVRAVLNKADATQSDEVEYNRGRLIGSIERVLLLAMVATGNWAAMGFVIAAKSLVRSREFENNRTFAEYFLIGTLTSSALAIVAGALVRLAFVSLW